MENHNQAILTNHEHVPEDSHSTTARNIANRPDVYPTRVVSKHELIKGNVAVLLIIGVSDAPDSKGKHLVVGGCFRDFCQMDNHEMMEVVVTTRLDGLYNYIEHKLCASFLKKIRCLVSPIFLWQRS